MLEGDLLSSEYEIRLLIHWSATREGHASIERARMCIFIFLNWVLFGLLCTQIFFNDNWIQE